MKRTEKPLVNGESSVCPPALWVLLCWLPHILLHIYLFLHPASERCQGTAKVLRRLFVFQFAAAPLLGHELYDVFVLEHMRNPNPLGLMFRACAPYECIFELVNIIAMDRTAYIFDSTSATQD